MPPGVRLRPARASRPEVACRYANIERIYTLPRPQPAGSLVVVHLETAIRRGQTYYEWLAFFFDDKAHVDLDLNTSQEARPRKIAPFVGSAALSCTRVADVRSWRCWRGGASVQRLGGVRVVFGRRAHSRAGARVQFLDGKNKANRANMELHMLGATDSVLTRLLRGLSGAKVTKQGSYRGHDGVSSWLGCSYRNDAGARARSPVLPAHACRGAHIR